MRIEIKPWGETILYLSKRNLLTLLQKVTEGGSGGRLEYLLPNGDQVFVVAEDDRRHYGKRKPNPISPAAERFIQAQEQVDAEHL